MSKTFNDAVNAAALDVAQLVADKQRDYGPKNILNCPVGPELGLVVRLSDKLARLSNLIQNNVEPTNEAVIDTWRDIVGYGLVGLMVNEQTFTLPLEPKNETTRTRK